MGLGATLGCVADGQGQEAAMTCRAERPRQKHEWSAHPGFWRINTRALRAWAFWVDFASEWNSAVRVAMNSLMVMVLIVVSFF